MPITGLRTTLSRMISLNYTCKYLHSVTFPGIMGQDSNMCFLESPFDPLWMASYIKLYLGAFIHAVIRAGAPLRNCCLQLWVSGSSLRPFYSCDFWHEHPLPTRNRGQLFFYDFGAETRVRISQQPLTGLCGRVQRLPSLSGKWVTHSGQGGGRAAVSSKRRCQQSLLERHALFNA